MAVRKQCNRYRTEPYGMAYEEVLKKAKAFYRTAGVFELTQSSSGMWHAQSETNYPFIKNETARTYKFNYQTNKWLEVVAE